MMVWRVLVVKVCGYLPIGSVPPLWIKLRRTPGRGFMHYSCSRWAVVGARHPPPSHPSRQPPLMLLLGITRGAIHQYFAHHTPPPLQSSLFEWLQGHPERIRKVGTGHWYAQKCCLKVKFIFQSSQVWKITIKITHPSIAKQPFLALHVLYIFKPQRVEDWFLRFEKKTPMPLHSYVCPLSNWTGN